MKKPTKKCIDELSRIIMRLEAWQARHAGCAPVSEANHGKSHLIGLVSKLESLKAK